MLQNKMVNSTENILRNLEQVRSRIVQSARRAGRDPQEVRLVVVTKTHPVQDIETLLEAGVDCIGESYVEEALLKIADLAGRSGVEWHMIGHVQSRKAQQVCENFQFLHSLDSLKLANHLNRFAREHDKILPVLLECNVSAEESKFGWPAWDEDRWPELLSPIAQILALSNLDVRGVMTIAPFDEDPSQSRPYFSRLRKLKAFLSSKFQSAKWEELSMGMSADFEVAIEEGATMVRIGEAILGPRGTI
jgi:pyridoxal phosphate enzyme (YggS family)